VRRFGLLLAAAVLVPAVPAAAQFTVFESGHARLGLTGYVRAFTGVHDLGYDPPASASNPRTTGFHGEVVRLKWQAEREGWRLDVHNRVQAQVTSGGGDGPVLGIGVTTVPDRLVDLETVIVDEPGVRVWHDLDRLSVTAYTALADITVGRQAITWGVSSLFPVADLWAQFSPFELDTEEKPGIDAVRALFYPTEGLEMDAVLADRGALDDLSVGLRATYALAGADVWAGGGKFWREALTMGGVTVLFDETRLRAEFVVPYDLDADRWDNPRITLGTDWIRGTLTLTGEYHFNGIGAAGTSGYVDRLGDPRFVRGETYYVGRHYLGGLASWSPDQENRVTLAANALANLQDASIALTPVFGYDLGQSSRVSVGALLSWGETPRFDRLPPTLGSEFGTYGDLLFTRVSVYF
jgi:hypothetical protein